MTALLDVKAFKGMDSAELDRIEASSRVLVPHDGARLFVEGDTADAVYAIMKGSGHVRVGAPDTNSKGLMIDVFGPGDIFDEMGVIERSTRTADAVAEGRVTPEAANQQRCYTGRAPAASGNDPLTWGTRNEAEAWAATLPRPYWRRRDRYRVWRPGQRHLSRRRGLG